MWKGRKRKLSENDKIIESVSFSKWDFPVTGRCVVELDLLAKELDGGCKACGNTQETISGLGSFLYITCGEETCGKINMCHMSKMH